jgi:MFS family permease
MMMGGTLPIPLYVLYEKQMGFGPLGVTVVFASYVVGTLAALVTLGDLSDHIGRRRVLATGVASPRQCDHVRRLHRRAPAFSHPFPASRGVTAQAGHGSQ